MYNIMIGLEDRGISLILSRKLKFLNINFQSKVNKVPEFICLIDCEKPDDVIGTESWLSPEISDNEIFPPVYTPSAQTASKTPRSGGVFILVRKTSSAQSNRSSKRGELL